MAHRAEQQDVAEPVVISALGGERREVLRGERAMAHDVALVGGQREQTRPMFVRQQPSSPSYPPIGERSVGWMSIKRISGEQCVESSRRRLVADEMA
jgi:hypothetical protein